MNVHTFWSRRGAANFLLWPLSMLWGAAQRFHRLRYGLFPPKPAPGGVRTISVGNILVGGSGKTPFAIYLAKLLQSRGERTAVVLRGYRGAWERCGGVVSDSDGLRPDAEKGSDEALLLARSLPGVPVAVGADRRASIERLLSLDPDLRWVILDDAFQHLRLPHSVSFVLFNVPRGLGNGMLLPAGPLREPLSTVKRADAAVLVGEGDTGFLPTGLPVIHAQYRPGQPVTLAGEPVSLDELRRGSVALASGIGNPASFEQTVRELGVRFDKHFAWPDHHDFSGEFSRLRAHGADWLLITAKDAARLHSAPDDLPFVVLPIELTVEDDEAVLQALMN